MGIEARKVKMPLQNLTHEELLREAELSEDPLVRELARRLAEKLGNQNC